MEIDRLLGLVSDDHRRETVEIMGLRDFPGHKNHNAIFKDKKYHPSLLFIPHYPVCVISIRRPRSNVILSAVVTRSYHKSYYLPTISQLSPPHTVRKHDAILLGNIPYTVIR